MSHWHTKREDWPSPSELADDLAWAEYLRTYDDREAAFLAWCREHEKDPQDVGSAIEYETDYELDWNQEHGYSDQ